MLKPVSSVTLATVIALFSGCQSLDQPASSATRQAVSTKKKAPHSPTKETVVIYQNPVEAKPGPHVERITFRPELAQDQSSFVVSQTEIRGTKQGVGRPFSFSVSLNGSMPVPDNIITLYAPRYWTVTEATNENGDLLKFTTRSISRSDLDRHNDKSLILQGPQNRSPTSSSSLANNKWTVSFNLQDLKTLPHTLKKIHINSKAAFIESTRIVNAPMPEKNTPVAITDTIILTLKDDPAGQSLAFLEFKDKAGSFSRERDFPIKVTVHHFVDKQPIVVAGFVSRYENADSPMTFAIRKPSPIMSASKAQAPATQMSPTLEIELAEGFAIQNIEAVVKNIVLLDDKADFDN